MFLTQSVNKSDRGSFLLCLPTVTLLILATIFFPLGPSKGSFPSSRLASHCPTPPPHFSLKCKPDHGSQPPARFPALPFFQDKIQAPQHRAQGHAFPFSRSRANLPSPVGSISPSGAWGTFPWDSHVRAGGTVLTWTGAGAHSADSVSAWAALRSVQEGALLSLVLRLRQKNPEEISRHCSIFPYIYCCSCLLFIAHHTAFVVRMI